MNLHSKPSWLDLESVIPLERRKRRSGSGKEDDRRSVEEITNLSHDTLRRRFPKLIKKLSDRRRGMKLRDALEIADGQ
jgi:hypothetical protein